MWRKLLIIHLLLVLALLPVAQAISPADSSGDAEDQVKHAIMMQKMPDMGHSDPNTVSLAPGKSAKLSWKFMGEDTVIFACNIPGHFEAGMKHALAIKGNSSEKLAAN